MDFARIHVFPFSARPRTAAATMPDQVSPQVKKERGERMRAIADQSAAAFRRRFLGSIMDVLWENRKASRWNGLTDNYIRVWTTAPQNLANRITPARLVELSEQGIRGVLVTEASTRSSQPRHKP
jgi:threonylcarbamoyladenosine tRNA methylthiotransferase MtaB